MEEETLLHRAVVGLGFDKAPYARSPVAGRTGTRR
ncbi:hypothetical protein PS9374_02737 [Planomonospora sphaerica]|uniref:Uncharacterized protein n=1 Tax=Planomonospora sphaerica TaxID=161355 RepID=A0A161LHD6_9ACTN|nr:hypothetical protein PS9374_02737 [Planomonospora sphaerica]